MTVLLSDGYRVARKRHVCRVCRGWIGVGDRYYEQRVADGGPPYSWRCHHLCFSVFHHLAEPWWDDYDYPEDESVRGVLTAVFRAIGDVIG